MDNVIRVAQIAEIAMTEDAGMELRKKIAEVLKKCEKVVLDFENVMLFATPFFNASVGYYIFELSPEKYQEVISTKNLSALGKETYDHSVENAQSIYEKRENRDVVGRITAETIEGK